MTEAQLYQQMRRATPQVDWQRIENLIGAGVSDVNGCLNGVEAWIELKIFHGNSFTFRISQPPWIAKRVAHGGRVFIVARRGNTCTVYTGGRVDELISLGVAHVDGVPRIPGPKDAWKTAADYHSAAETFWPGFIQRAFAPVRTPNLWKY